MMDIHYTYWYNHFMMHGARCKLYLNEIKKISYIHIMEYYSALKKKILPNDRTWGGILLSEISQSQDKYFTIPFV